MPVQSLEYKRYILLPAQAGKQWTVLIRQPDQVLYHPEVAMAEDYREAIWRAQRIVDGICQKSAPREVIV